MGWRNSYSIDLRDRGVAVCCYDKPQTESFATLSRASPHMRRWATREQVPADLSGYIES